MKVFFLVPQFPLCHQLVLSKSVVKAQPWRLDDLTFCTEFKSQYCKLSEFSQALPLRSCRDVPDAKLPVKPEPEPSQPLEVSSQNQVMRVDFQKSSSFSFWLKPPTHHFHFLSLFSPQTCFGFLGCFDNVFVNKTIPKTKHVFSLMIDDLLHEKEYWQLGLHVDYVFFLLSEVHHEVELVGYIILPI